MHRNELFKNIQHFEHFLKQSQSENVEGRAIRFLCIIFFIYLFSRFFIFNLGIYLQVFYLFIFSQFLLTSYVQIYEF